MAALSQPRVSIIGLGAIGGSVALRLVQRGMAPRAFTPDAEDARAGKASGVRVETTIEAAARNADVVLLAVPLNVVAEAAATVVPAMEEQATLLHTASLQRQEALAAPASITARLIGSHPVAGTHASGFAAATTTMFDGAVVSIEERANASQRAAAEMLWGLVGADRVEYQTAEAHDRRMAWVSHLPQLASTALAAAMAAGGVSVAQLGSGGRDGTRVAASSLAMWAAILNVSPPDTLMAIKTLEETLLRLRSALERKDRFALEQMWEEARRWRSAAVPSQVHTP